MKNGMDSTAVGRAPETESFGNRKLIRPSLTRETREAARTNDNGDRERRTNGSAAAKKTPPPDQTHAENFYWVKQMQGRTPMAIVLDNGEILRGTVEWYDRDCIKLTRQGSPNLLVFKRVIKYVYKDSEENR